MQISHPISNKTNGAIYNRSDSGVCNRSIIEVVGYNNYRIE